MKYFIYTPILVLFYLAGCRSEKMSAGRYVGNWGDNLTFKKDSNFYYSRNTDAGMVAFSKGKYKVKNGWIFLDCDFKNSIKTIECNVKENLGGNHSTIVISPLSSDENVVFEALVNNKKWYLINKPVIIDSEIKSIKLKAYLVHGIVFGTVPTIDTLSSDLVLIKNHLNNKVSYEISSNIDSRDFFRVQKNDTLKIINSKKVKWVGNNAKMIWIPGYN